jgi:catechol 2,3-dioxygenase-like lactoylglutathione lyase family enzyme
MPRFTGVSHVELTVRDVVRSAAWYEQVLGMRRMNVPDEYRTHGVAAEVVSFAHPSGLSINLMQHEFGDDGEFSELRVGLDHLSLNVESREELERWTEHLDDCSVRRSAISDMPYGSVVVLRDPDNIQLELLALAPGLHL